MSDDQEFYIFANNHGINLYKPIAQGKLAQISCQNLAKTCGKQW